MADAYDFWAARLDGDTSAAVGQFWEKFVRAAPDLDRAFRGEAADFDPAGAMAEALGPLNEYDLFWEFGPGEESGHHLALTPELHHSMRPLARALVQQAPQLDGWSFSDARPPVRSADQIVSVIEARTQMAYPLDALAPVRGEERTISFEGEGRGSAGTLDGMASITFSVVFGEAIERDWLGECAMRSKNALTGMFAKRVDPDSWLPEFSAQTLALLEDLMATRLDKPVWQMGSDEWTLFQMEPDPESDAPRSDMITYSTNQPDLVSARFSHLRFSPNRFSRFGENFCGIRIPRTAEQAFDQVEDRDALSEAVDAALRLDQIGGLVGAAHGTDNVYIDFATTDIEAAVARIELLLNQRGVMGPIDMLFDEAGLEDLTLRLSGFGRVQ